MHETWYVMTMRGPNREIEYRLPKHCPRCGSVDVWAEIGDHSMIVEQCGN